MAYSALQNCEKSMVAGDALNVAGNGVSIPKQLKAGAVMALNLRGGQKDTAGAAINSEWMPVDTKALLAGEDISADALGNTGNPNKICNPDNLKFSEKMRTLFIGEDSGQHVNNFLWAYNIDTKQLSRLMSIPAGGESTGLHAVDEINGWTYIMSNFQHAGDWGAIHNVVKPTLDPLISANYRGKFGARRRLPDGHRCPAQAVGLTAAIAPRRPAALRRVAPPHKGHGFPWPFCMSASQLHGCHEPRLLACKTRVILT